LCSEQQANTQKDQIIHNLQSLGKYYFTLFNTICNPLKIQFTIFKLLSTAEQMPALIFLGPNNFRANFFQSAQKKFKIMKATALQCTHANSQHPDGDSNPRSFFLKT
jgi:hypothetical protein